MIGDIGGRIRCDGCCSVGDADGGFNDADEVCVVTVKFVGVLRGEIPTLAIVVVSRQELCDLRAGKQRTMNARWKEVEVVSCDFTHRTDYPFSGPVDCFVLSDETTMPFALSLVLVGVIGQPEFITCCSTQCIARYTPRVTAMVMEDSLLGFANHFPTTIDWRICFIDCQDAIGHELGNTMTGGHHRGAILGEQRRRSPWEYHCGMASSRTLLG